MFSVSFKDQFVVLKSRIMKYVVWLFFLNVFLANGMDSENPYCAMSQRHTMCRFAKFKLTKEACNSTLFTPISYLKAKHNNLRNSYARGTTFNATIPNMHALEWDEELEEIAVAWAKQCPESRDEFRDVDSFRVANLFSAVSSLTNDRTIDRIWDSLLEGKRFFHKKMELSSTGKHLMSDFDISEPLTLITNPYFKYFGCAAVHYDTIAGSKTTYRTVLVCNYGPLEDPYQSTQPTGPPCSLCDDGYSCQPRSMTKNLCFDADISVREKRESGKINKIYAVDPCKWDEKNKIQYDHKYPLMNDDTKKLVVQLHNKFRNDLAGGENFSWPLAANMREVNWDDTLQNLAKNWTDRCLNRPDKCRSRLKEPLVPSGGNNTIQLYDRRLMRGDDFPAFSSIFANWVEEITYLDQNTILSYEEPETGEMDYSEISQIIWANTYKLGCSMMNCRSDIKGESELITACYYYPAGLTNGEKIYKFGGPCTSCMKLRPDSYGGAYCSIEYPNLCSGAAPQRVFELTFLIIGSLLGLALFSVNQ